MSAPLRIVKPGQDQLGVQDLLGLLHPDHLDAIELKAKKMREVYPCPATVRDYNDFKELLFDYFAHYQHAFYNADFKLAAGSDTYWRDFAYEFVQQHLSAYQGDIRAAERNAITGRAGGAMGVIDALTEGIAKFHKENYVKGVFFDRIAPSDYDTRLRLAKELLDRFGPLMFPGEDIQPYFMLGMHLEQLFQAFVTHLHAIRRQWRH